MENQVNEMQDIRFQMGVMEANGRQEDFLTSASNLDKDQMRL
jgi:hypothetical protein